MPSEPLLPDKWYARRKVRSRHVVCGKCGAHLAKVCASRDSTSGDNRSAVLLEPGWTLSPSSVWYLTGHAQDRLRRGKEAAFRRPANRDAVQHMTEEYAALQAAERPHAPLPQNKLVSAEMHHYIAVAAQQQVQPLPLRARCPRCAVEQTLE